MAKFEMTKRKRKRAIDPIIAYAGIGNLGPADRRQADIRPVQICQKGAISARIPAEKVQNTSDRSRVRRLRCSGRNRGGPSPGSRMSFIETKLAAHVVVDLQLLKIGCALRPFHFPLHACNKIALVRAIPKLGARLDRGDPAKNCKKVEAGNCGLVRAGPALSANFGFRVSDLRLPEQICETECAKKNKPDDRVAGEVVSAIDF